MILLNKYNLSLFKHNHTLKHQKKKRKLLSKTKLVSSTIKNELRTKGFRAIKNYSILTWKYSNNECFRITFIGKYENKKYIIKIAKGFDNKMNNSIRFHNIFNDRFSFVPYGKELLLQGYKCLMTEYIDSYEFSLLPRKMISKKILSFLHESLDILERMRSYSCVHCDLSPANILIRKKDFKLFLIDFDNVSCQQYGLWCDDFELPYTIRQRVGLVDGKTQYMYDDAFSFYTIYNSLKLDTIATNRDFLSIKKMIGTNYRIAIQEDK